MSVKFQAEMKEPDEKFAAISEDAKRRYDRHRFIRRAIMVFWAALVFMFYVDDELEYYVYSYAASRDARPSSLNLYLVFLFYGDNFSCLYSILLFKNGSTELKRIFSYHL